MKKSVIITLLPAILLCAGCGVLSLPVMEHFTAPISVIDHLTAPISVSNPFSRLADVSPVACYGDSHTGNVRFVFMIRSKSNIIRSGGFGSSFGSKFIAYGKAYTPHSSSKQSVELVQGVTAECVIPNIRDVPNTIGKFDRIELDWYFNPEHHSGAYGRTLDFYNVPVIWDMR